MTDLSSHELTYIDQSFVIVVWKLLVQASLPFALELYGVGQAKAATKFRWEVY